MSNTKEKCLGFQWVGQAVCHCDGCGRPIWEHEYDRAPGHTPFSEQTRKRADLSARALSQLRWKYTMLITEPKYCRQHQPHEYTGMSLEELEEWIDKLREWRN